MGWSRSWNRRILCCIGLMLPTFFLSFFYLFIYQAQYFDDSVKIGQIYRIPHPNVSRSNDLSTSSLYPDGHAGELDFHWMEELYSKYPSRHSDVRVWCVSSDVCKNNKKKTPPLRQEVDTISLSPHHPILPQPYSKAYTGNIGTKTRPHHKQGCEPASKWHLNVPATCNIMHEIDIIHGVERGASALLQSEESVDDNEVKIKLLAHGAMREAWTMDSSGFGVSTNKVILKTLRTEMDFGHDMFTRQLKDAIATEQLTSSLYVVDIYGYCGMSVLNEFADGGDLHQYIEEVHGGNMTSPEKLLIARDAALALADIHEIDGPNKTTLVHHDVRSSNFVVVAGKVKANDFNQARLLESNPKTGKLCGFYWSKPCDEKSTRVYPRAPEECIHLGKRFSEKVETYRFGSLLFEILTGEHPYSKFEPEGPDRPFPEVVTWIVDKKRIPNLPKEIEESGDPHTIALKKGVRMAMTQELKERPRTRAVANYLVAAVDKMNSFVEEHEIRP